MHVRVSRRRRPLRAFLFLLALPSCATLRDWRDDNNAYHSICLPACPKDWLVFYDGAETCTCMDPQPHGDMYQVPAPVRYKRYNFRRYL